MSGVRFAASVEDGNEGGIGRIGFPRVHLAALFGVGGDGNGVEEERVLEVCEKLVEVIS